MLPAMQPLIEIEADLSAPQSIGQVPGGERRCVPILGGRVTGRVRGTILPGGADWQFLRPDGLADIDARYMFETPAGARVEVWSRGLRHGPADVMQRVAAGEPVDPALYYFRTALRFETAAPDLQWLVRTLAIGQGERRAMQVRIRAFAVP